MSDIIGFEAAAAALDRLLEEVRVKLNELQGQSGQAATEARNKLADRLVDYVKATKASKPSEVSAIRRLDEIANEARRAVMNQEIGAAIGVLQESSAALAGLTKGFDDETQRNADMARGIRLQPIRDIVASTSETIAELKQASDEIRTDPSLSIVAKRADSFRGALERLRSALDGVS